MRSRFDQRTLVTAKPAPSVAASHKERLGTLVVLIGADVGALFTLTKAATLIGRSPDADVDIPDDGVSRNHARIVACNGRYEIEDLGSTNGTFVDNRRITGRAVLQDGARVHLGHTLFRFALQDEIEREASRRIYEMSVRDGLTGVFNRRCFDDRLKAEFAFALRHGAPLCVLLADVDHFKRINDQLGHQAGDLVLCRIASALQAGIRAEDFMARYGGEEFAIIARGIDARGAVLFAERVRTLVERAQIVWEGKRISATISIGVAHNQVGPAFRNPEGLTAKADEALYAAKRTGRNRVVCGPAPDRDSPSQGAGSQPRRRRHWEQATQPQDE